MAAQPEPDPHDTDPPTDPPLSASPDDDINTFSGPSPDGRASPSQQVPKRKGGRKPVYATVEERKQRNRQAQAAFRERRTEYIKQLEATLKQHEQLLQTAQNDRHAVSNECAALRYRLSTIEKILLEKGIDVDAELRAKGGYPDAVFPALLPATRPKPEAMPITDNPELQSRHMGRGLAPKTDLRAKMSQLQASVAPPAASPHDQNAMPLMPWQAAPGSVERSPVNGHFRSGSLPVFDAGGPSYAVERDFASPTYYDGRQLPGDVAIANSYHMPMDLPQHDASRPMAPHDHMNFQGSGSMPGLAKAGSFDFYQPT